MFASMVAALQTIMIAFQQNSWYVLSIIALLWLVTLLNLVFNHRLSLLGILPRNPLGLIGIIFSPFIHASFDHIFFNSIPLFILMNLVLLNGKTNFIIISLSIIILTGSLIWLFGRRALHIGASGIIMGYFGYLLAQAIFVNSTLAIGLAVVLVYYFGSLLLSIFPTQERVSWEGHLLGLLAGFAVSFFYPTLLTLIGQ